jgi:hypothetical protein
VISRWRRKHSKITFFACKFTHQTKQGSNLKERERKREGEGENEERERKKRKREGEGGRMREQLLT